MAETIASTDSWLQDMYQIRPDLTLDEARLALRHLILTAPKGKALTACAYRNASFEALGGALYTQAQLRHADGAIRPVVVQLFSGRVTEGTLEGVVEKLHADPYCSLYDVSEVSRVWMNRQSTLVFEGYMESPTFDKVGKDLAIALSTFVSARTDTAQMRELYDQLRTAHVAFVKAPTITTY